MAHKSKKNGAARTPKITWAEVAALKDSGKTAEELRAESESTAHPEPQAPQRRSVPRSSLHLAEKVFQWRGGPKEDRYEREKHIHTLATELKNQGAPLARLTVWPVGDRLYVLDGHHRLAAYDTVKWPKPIPVEVHGGSLDAARLRALRGNIRDKLRMTREQKSETAWTIIKENIGNLSADEIAWETTISRRQVFIMRKVWNGLKERTDLSEELRERLPEITWRHARDFKNGGDGGAEEGWDADIWIDGEADALADLIRKKNVEYALMKNPEITARALSRMSGGTLPQMLIEEWAGDHRELIVELAKAFTAPDDDF